MAIALGLKKRVSLTVSKKKEKDMQEETIIIDKENDLIFNSEDEVLKHFATPIKVLEKEFLENG